MKSSFIIIFCSVFINSILFAESLYIESKNIILDKNKATSIFENEVVVITEDKQKIKSDYAKYNKSVGRIEFKKNIVAVDALNNIIKTDDALYNEKTNIFESIGPTTIITSERYIIEGNNIVFDNNKKFIASNEKTIITDEDNNKIYLENFDYQTESNIFKSIGLIKIEDNKENSYEFSQIYIDTKKKEILGTDNKAFLNDESFKINKNNNPRIFANTLRMNKETNSFNKSIFTLCAYRKDDKCPPWSIQASQMLHDRKKKTIYYDNAVIKVYDIPLFYLPKLSHPDHTVSRRSGFLIPSFSNTKNLGSGMSIPYFWALNEDKNFTLTNKLYFNENPLFLGDYHQAFKDSNFKANFGYTEGYQKKSITKKAGKKSHFFAKYVKNFNRSINSEDTLDITLQDVSNDKYLKLYKIDSDLVDYNENTLENSINYTHEKENIFLGFKSSIYETLSDTYNDKYEYIFPEITFDKNLLSSETSGNLDLQTNYKLHKYDTNKLESFLINNFNWESNEINYDTGIKGRIISNVKNINYETKNIDVYKKDTTSEIYGALGYLSEINLRKMSGGTTHLWKPRILLRYAPGSMRKENSGSRLDPNSAFSMTRLDNINNFETGLSSTLGFDYKIKSNDKELDFSVAQIINEKENKKMASKTSLDEKLSDLVGSSTFKIKKGINFNYNFSVDQNYNQLNYNEVGADLNFNPIKIDFSYLQESEHIGDQEYFKTKIDFMKGEDGIFSFETKRNLVKDSSEFYNLSYEYINDCLRAGLVYRREFYEDSEIEPENSLMFKITLTPFGDIASPSFSQ